MADTLTPLSRRSWISLDGLRGLAIIAVLCCHSAHSIPYPAVQNLLGLGWSGVDLFFVLSGFLITGILLDTRAATNVLRSFYCRRILRIFPLYYSFLIVAFLEFPRIVSVHWMPVRSDWWLYVSYLMNWQMLWHEPWHSNVLGHFWSLCVEEQFYFAWPLVVLAVRPLSLLRGIVALELAMLGGRSWWVWSHGASVVLTTLTITRMDGLLLGAACALVVREFRVPQWAARVLPWIAASCLTAFLVGFQQVEHRLQDGFIQSVGFALLATGFAAILLTAVLTDSRRTRLQVFLRRKPLTRFGKYAYGIYVFHVPIFYFVDRIVLGMPAALQHSFWVGCLSLLYKFAISYGAAGISYNFFEKKFLLLKGRFEPHYGQTIVQPPSTVKAWPVVKVEASEAK